MPRAKPPVEAALEHVRRLAAGPPLDRTLRVTLHFHPDRLFDGLPLLERVLRDGVYRSQFETGTSNGGLTAYEGGARWKWEQRIFGGAYDDAPAAVRPKYGALNHRRRDFGGSIRFGSAHLRLAEATLDRTSFCYPDSVFSPTTFGTAEHLDLIRLADREDRDLLDDYVEAHVHGPVRIADVEALVLDPAYRGTEVEAIAAAWPVPVEWHRGFVLAVEELDRHPDYRGAEVVAAGHRIALGGRLDAAVIGIAAATGEHDHQTLKRIWHCVARFGRPA